ncbi:hypothetical protein STEG23_026377, partial [Scotinomys teguina]
RCLLDHPANYVACKTGQVAPRRGARGTDTDRTARKIGAPGHFRVAAPGPHRSCNSGSREAEVPPRPPRELRGLQDGIPSPCSPSDKRLSLRPVHGRSNHPFYADLMDDPELQPILFGLFLSMYLVTVLGNLLIILAVSSNSHLHNPMYFFLSNLSFIDICFVSTTIPKMLVNIWSQRKDISYTECLTQVILYPSVVFDAVED